jgi:hypothetical protein
MIFRGTGIRIKQSEYDQYHPDVTVRFQPKAWADRNFCVTWAEEDFCDYILESGECDATKEFLLSHDNLDGQVQPEWKAALRSRGVKGNAHSLLAGNTDGIQVVDGGVGASIKREEEEVFDEWCETPTNWAEWSSGRMSASRKRVLFTMWYGEAWDRVCKVFNFCKVFDKTGANLTADGSEDDKIKIEGLDSFSFTKQDALRCHKTGLMSEDLGATAGEGDDSDSEDNSEEEFDLEQPTADGEDSSTDEGDTDDDEQGLSVFLCPDGLP